MKNIIFTLFFVCIYSLAQAATISISWDPVTLDIDGNTESIGNYILYYGTTSRPANVSHPSDDSFSYDNTSNAGNVAQTETTGLEAGQTYYLSVAAVDTGGNISNYSEEVSIAIPQGPDDPDDPQDPGTDEVVGGCSCSSGHPTGYLWLLAFLAAWIFIVRPICDKNKES
jgi:hypothetical protein